MWNMYRIKETIELFSNFLHYIILPLAFAMVIVVIFTLFKKQCVKLGNWLAEHVELLLLVTLCGIGLWFCVAYGKYPQNIVGIILIGIIFVVPFAIYMYHEWSKHKDVQYWKKFHQTYGYPTGCLHIPMKFYGDFNAHFWLYDKHGDVKDSAVTEKEAIRKHKETGLYISRIIEKYPTENE